jgi:uncharacterized membrane protein
MDQPIRRLFPRWPSFAVLLLTATYLRARWDSIPARWVIHWGPRGEPNGWATRTMPGVFGLLVLAAILIVVNEAVAGIRRTGSAVDESMRTATVDFMRIVMFGVTITMALLSVDLPLGPPMSLLALLLLSLAPVVVAVVAGGTRLAATLRERRESGRDGAKRDGYHALYYASANDRRLWVPKLSGMGWTINFSHPLAWPMFVLVLALPIAAVVLSLTAR